MDPNHISPPHEPSVPSAGQGRATVRDRRPMPQGLLPRHVQTWIMVGLALLILVVILMTGRPEPGLPASTTAVAAPTSPISPARVQSYQERLAEQEARLRQDAAGSPSVIAPVDVPMTPTPTPSDPLVDERRRRDAQSLFADNVAFTRRATVGAAPADTRNTPAQTADPSAAISASQLSARDAAVAPDAKGAATGTGVNHASGAATAVLETLTEGTVIETVLVNRLDGTFQGPVDCLVTTPVYSRDRRAIVIPAGARVVGSAAAIRAWGESRLAVTFHRLLLPDGQTHRLDAFPGLNQVGEAGLKDVVDRHYLQVFGASLAIGAIAGLAQVGTRGSFDPSFGDAARQSAGGSLATSTARVLDRYLNVLPTVTIREGHRIKVVLTGDLQLPAYEPTVVMQGGA